MKFKFIQKLNVMYYSALVGLVLTTIYTALLMVTVKRTSKRVKYIYQNQKNWRKD
ncbi:MULTISPECIES: hypothetical protein [unclassified Bacillus (in: firmicutes)]|uniref:hypothetical protein n=1 Tax=unclassified Bacillus (in: firmicutes) TaxID=185979 RepID=UPI001BEB92FE|nr:MULTISPECIES: hypothetical protein [unclassified Bacillus (in: firmicutes)]MBT2722161.1 hypothetical protein [Bacillus sp. ISL-46]MBT2730723.1 hypothetical protein [Bacillus sp. ISL-75]